MGFVSGDNIGIEEGVPHIKTGANTRRELEEPIISHHSLKNYRVGVGRIAQLGKGLLCKLGDLNLSPRTLWKNMGVVVLACNGRSEEAEVDRSLGLDGQPT